MRLLLALSDTSPASASTAVGAGVASGFQDVTSLSIVATLTGATGGVLDVYLQTSFDGGTTWYDYAHWTQISAAAAAVTKVWHMHRSIAVSTIATIGSGSTPALAANAINGGAWGNAFRLVYVAGASTSAGAVQTVRLFGWR